MEPQKIRQNIENIKKELLPGVILEAAVKGRKVGEIKQALNAGVEVLGENYVQEAFWHRQEIKDSCRWHFIGRLQKNKINKALALFDMIETLHSLDLALEIEKRCQREQKTIEVLVEVNIAKEEQKNGIAPEEVESFLLALDKFSHLKVKGLMAMGPNFDNPEKLRPYFRRMHQLFENAKKLNLARGEMKYLSLGMSASFKVAMEEGANLVRIGTAIFGPRDY